MSTERLIVNGDKSDSSTLGPPDSISSTNRSSQAWLFEELPKATILSVSRPETGDISPMLLSYELQFQYKQFKWRLSKKASQVLYLHFALKKRAIIQEFHEKQEQVKEWLHSLGIVGQLAVVQDQDEPDDGAFPVHHEESLRNRNVPSMAVFPILRPSLGRLQGIANRAKVAMQGYLNLFLGNLDIVNTPEVCKFLEVSKLSFSQEYGPKLKEGYIMVRHLTTKSRADANIGCFPRHWLNFCGNNWEKVWAVLKPGFLALLEDPFDANPLDIILFDVMPSSYGKDESQSYLAERLKERNPLRYAFKVSCGSRCIKFRTTSSGKIEQWVTAINDVGHRSPDRFGSFAPQRGLTDDGSQTQWFIDGQAGFEAIASAIEDAKSEIFITGWWLCPELYLRRPFQDHSASRLDALLEAKAKLGVQIYILLYKEVAVALKINSMYSKKRLLDIHENVKVLRYPDHLSTGVYLWSHHEKLVIVDYQICFIGGLDLCFGRYDTTGHKISDFPADIWPGKDYYNPRESEPNSWEDMMKDELQRDKCPRMPWHDVHCALWGPPCRDVARHFVQRWNHAKRNKAPNEPAIPLLMPHFHMVIPHYMRSSEIEIDSKSTNDNTTDVGTQDSVSSQSPLLDIPLLLPHEADEKLFASVEVQKLNGLYAACNILDQPTTTERSFQFSGNADEWSEASAEDDQDVFPCDFGQVGPRAICRCQVLRSVSHWSAGTNTIEESIHSAYCYFIEKAEHFIYIENQFFISGLSGDDIIQNRVMEALYRRILIARKEDKCFRVIVVLPLLPGFQGGIDDGDAATVRALMHWQYRTISRENTSILHNLDALLGPKTQDYISFYGLRSYGRLFDGGPAATSQVYVHSKLMIIDDRVTFIGSSNINDRSLLGSRDSEIGVVLEDKEFLETSMDGMPWKAGKFSYSLRCSLWSEHLGLQAGEINQISDPVADNTYKNLWLATAEANTEIYQDVFACIPNEVTHSRAALRQTTSLWKEKIGYNAIDLGIAPEKLESYENGEIKLTDPMERLKAIKGLLVMYPLKFMCQEDLRPGFIESEFYASSQVFH